MARSKYGWAVRVLPMLIASAYASGAMAQEKIEEVLVTAQKRSEKLQEVPISITAISGAQLENRGIEGIAGLNAVAPNMMFRANPGNNLISTVALRGSGTGQPAIWVDPSVGMYLDGVYIGKSQGSVFDVIELERVEVLRGPQGTLFGRNTEGGAVSLISRRPTGVWGGSVGVEIGNRSLHTERVALDLPKMGIASVSLGYRKEDQKGWAKNSSGPDLGKKDKEAFRLAADFQVAQNFKVGYSYDKSDIKNTPTPTSLLATSGWGGTFPSMYGAYLGGIIQSAITPFVTTTRPSNVSTYNPSGIWEKSTTEGHSLVLDYKLNTNNAVKYIYATRKMHFNDSQDIGGTGLNMIAAPFVPPANNWSGHAFYDRDTQYKQDSHELQWVGNADRLKYVLGLYYFKDDGTTLGPQDFSLFYGQPATSYTHSDYSAKTTTKALYGQLDYAFTDKWTGTAGLRHTSETKGGWTNRFSTTGYDGPLVANPGNFFSGNYSASFSGSTPMLALAYKYNDTTNVYGRVAKGFKSGGFSGELPNAAVMTPYKPQTSVSTEVGIKNSFLDNRAQLNVAVFRNKISDQQLTQLMPASTNSFLTNAGKSTYQGLELEGVLIPVDGWKLQASYGYLDTKYNQYIDNALNIAGRPLIDTAGNKLSPYAPKNTFNMSVDGRLAKTAWGTLRAIVDYTYTSETYLYSVNKDLTAPNAGGSYSAAMDNIPAQTNVNFKLLLAGLPVGGPGSADLSFWIKNLTDEKKQVQGIDFGMFRTANWQDPRTYGLSFSYKW